MLNLRGMIDKLKSVVMPTVNTKRVVTPVGAGFYGMQHNVSRAGVVYTKLVQRDKSRHLVKH